MPRRKDWLDRIKDVGFEYQAARIAMERLLADVRTDATIVRGRVEPRYVTIASDWLEGTYFTRMFAEFETGLRLYWATLRDTHPRTVELLKSLAGQRGIPDAQRENAHLVREYRNRLVHEREDEEVEVLSIATAKSHLCHFFRFLPLEWADPS